MARGRHYAKLSLSNAARLSFPDLRILLFLFLSLCRLCVCIFLCSHWSLVDVPLIFFCPADHVPDWQPRVLLGMVEARSVNVKKTTTQQQQQRYLNVLTFCRWSKLMRHQKSALFSSEIRTVRSHSIFCTNRHKIDIITTVLLYCSMVGLNTPILEKTTEFSICFTDT